MHSITIKLSVMVGLLISTIAYSQTNNEIVHFIDADNAGAATKLLSAFKKNGEDIEKFDDEGLILLWNSKAFGKYLLEPKMMDAGIDKIFVTKIYRVKFKYKHSDVMKDLVWQSNRKFSGLKFGFIDDGNLQVQGWVTFIKRIELAELYAYCKWVNEIDFIALELVDQNFRDYLE